MRRLPHRFTKPAIALAIAATLGLAGCSEDSKDAERQGGSGDNPSASVDFGDRQSVANAWGAAYAEGDCEAAAKLHVPDSYGIDCSDSFDYNPFVAAKNMGLTFKGAEPDTSEGRIYEGETVDAGNPEEFILTFTDANGYMLKSNPIGLEMQRDKYLVTSPLYDMPTAEDRD